MIRPTVEWHQWAKRKPRDYTHGTKGEGTEARSLRHQWTTHGRRKPDTTHAGKGPDTGTRDGQGPKAQRTIQQAHPRTLHHFSNRQNISNNCQNVAEQKTKLTKVEAKP